MSERFFCRECNRFFDNPHYYEETHGLDSPPYERVSICPYCESDDFVGFDVFIEKYEVAEKLLPAVMKLNIFISSLKDVFGLANMSSDLDDAQGELIDMLCDAFDCFEYDFRDELLDMCTEYDLEKVMMRFDSL